MEGFTPLHYTVFWLDDKAVDLLLAFGAKIENHPATLRMLLWIALGRVYRDVHVKHDLEDSIWKQMVRLAERNCGEWTLYVLGINSCIERWRPGFAAHTELYDERRNVSLHRELRDKGVETVLRQQAHERRRHLLEALVQANGPLPFATPRCIEYVDGVKKNKHSVLDWAVVTGQHEHFLRRILQLGGVALSSNFRPLIRVLDFDVQRVQEVLETIQISDMPPSFV
ncbi:ankyrin unc44 [Colletotrichum incanum]|uniref:Ankyrin unc44 n=1 Tax=Colletotrichum incanum TaxID=1573173 RepID=A0A167DYS1_COLIC|nr:ankyrin unc44 [Colletotrichum incanum]